MTLTKLQKTELSHHHWRIFTNDSVTQGAIAEYLAQKGCDSDSKTEIFYAGKNIPVFMVTFETVEFLAKNKAKVPYSFTAYHRKSREGGWHVWREGMETPTQKLAKEFPITAPGLQHLTHAKKKRGKSMKRSVLMSK
jgi:hypothetical protein